MMALGLGCDGTATQLEPARTVRVVAGPIELIGDGPSACSHQPVESGGSPDRWCAFAGPHEKGGPAELWVINVTRAMRGEIKCLEGNDGNCLRLTTTLWTGEPVFAPSHPSVHGFYGDTLFFYTDATTTNPEDPFAGTVQAWRPGMTAGRVLTQTNGFYCFGHERASAAVCLTNQNSTSGVLEFDLHAGALDGGSGPMPMIERIRPYESDGSLSWGASFSPTGEYFAFSTRVPAEAGGQSMAPVVQRLRTVRASELGKTEPTEVLRDFQRWNFTPDGKKLLFLRGGVNTPEGPVGSSLTMVDFPVTGSPATLASGVDRYEAFGEVGGPLLGIGLIQESSELRGTFRMMRDVTRPMELVTVASDIEDVLVSPDSTYALFQEREMDRTPFSTVARTDGSGRCRLNRNMGQAALSVRFSQAKSRRRIFWTEDSPTATIEGWFADPETCAGAVRYSSALGYYAPTPGGLIWGEPDPTFTSMKVRYAPFKGDALDPDKTVEVAAAANFASGVLDDRYYFFTVRAGQEMAEGFYMHGPLR
jgi:hypothetical protein